MTPQEVTNQATPQAVTPQTVALQEVAPQGVTPQVVTPQGVTPQAMTPQAVAPQAVALQEVAPKGMIPQGVTLKVVAPQGVTPQAGAPKEVTPQDVAPQEVAPQGVTLQVVAPQAVAPQGVSPREVAPREETNQAMAPQSVAVTPQRATSDEEIQSRNKGDTSNTGSQGYDPSSAAQDKSPEMSEVNLNILAILETIGLPNGDDIVQKLANIKSEEQRSNSKTHPKQMGENPNKKTESTNSTDTKGHLYIKSSQKQMKQEATKNMKLEDTDKDKSERQDKRTCKGSTKATEKPTLPIREDKPVSEPELESGELTESSSDEYSPIREPLVLARGREMRQKHSRCKSERDLLCHSRHKDIRVTDNEHCSSTETENLQINISFSQANDKCKTHRRYYSESSSESDEASPSRHSHYITDLREKISPRQFQSGRSERHRSNDQYKRNRSRSKSKERPTRKECTSKEDSPNGRKRRLSPLSVHIEKEERQVSELPPRSKIRRKQEDVSDNETFPSDKKEKAKVKLL